jgi:hypothetical protein
MHTPRCNCTDCARNTHILAPGCSGGKSFRKFAFRLTLVGSSGGSFTRRWSCRISCLRRYRLLIGALVFIRECQSLGLLSPCKYSRLSNYIFLLESFSI